MLVLFLQLIDLFLIPQPLPMWLCPNDLFCLFLSNFICLQQRVFRWFCKYLSMPTPLVVTDGSWVERCHFHFQNKHLKSVLPSCCDAENKLSSSLFQMNGNDIHADHYWCFPFNLHLSLFFHDNHHFSQMWPVTSMIYCKLIHQGLWWQLMERLCLCKVLCVIIAFLSTLLHLLPSTFPVFHSFFSFAAFWRANYNARIEILHQNVGFFCVMNHMCLAFSFAHYCCHSYRLCFWEYKTWLLSLDHHSDYSI